jgi:hypothetical protein
MRTLRRRRTFFIVAVTTLALGIGAATKNRSSASSTACSSDHSPSPSPASSSPPFTRRYPEWLKEPILASSWDRITFLDSRIPRLARAAEVLHRRRRLQRTARWSSTAGMGPSRVSVVIGSASSLLSVLRARPQLGSRVSAGEDVPRGPAVTMVSHDALAVAVRRRFDP